MFLAGYLASVEDEAAEFTYDAHIFVTAFPTDYYSISSLAFGFVNESSSNSSILRRYARITSFPSPNNCLR